MTPEPSAASTPDDGVFEPLSALDRPVATTPRLGGSELIAQELALMGLDARVIDGWVYVAVVGGRLLYIGAEYGASLDATVYPHRPLWFTEAAKP